MLTIYAIHAPDPDKLAEVVAKMRVLGAPSIQAVDCGDYYMALEGSPRLAAAKQLGLTPDLIIFEQNTPLDVTKYDWFEVQNWAETICLAGEIAGELFSATQAVVYAFDGVTT